MINYYKKKPVEVQAVEYDNTDESRDFILSWIDNYGGDAYVWHVEDGVTNLIIGTLEGDMVANPGDYIIKGVKGEFYPCKPDIFVATYDEVGD